MISFDAKNLITNLCIFRKIYQERMLDTTIPQKETKKLLYLCTKHVHFSYGGRIYIQVDGVAIGSPLGPVLANISMTELDIAMIPSLGNKIGYIVNQSNSYDENIQFNFEFEEENKLAFLNVMVIRNTNDAINTAAYRKPRNTDIYINWHSYSPLQWKKTTANILIQRTIEICSDNKFLDEELDIIKHNLCEVNNYPGASVQNIVNYNIHKRNSIAPKLNEGHNSKEIFMNLKYAGQKGEQLMSKMKNN